MSAIIESPKRRNSDLIKLSPNHKSLDAELYGLGRTMRHLKPPGGKENGIFHTSQLPEEELTPQRKVNNYLKSHVFDTREISPRPATPALVSTHDHLFPDFPAEPKKVTHNNLRSTVFDPDPPKKAPVQTIKKNPITGESCKCIDDKYSQRKFILRNPITFEGLSQIPTTSRIHPPGGKCTLVLEYNE